MVYWIIPTLWKPCKRTVTNTVTFKVHLPDRSLIEVNLVKRKVPKLFSNTTP